MTDGAVHRDEASGGETSLSLLDKARANDGAAWERLFELYRPLVAYWCKRGNISDADVRDVTQEVFAAVSKHLDGFERKQSGSFRSWLKSIARTKIVDQMRRNRLGAATGGSEARQQLENVPDPEMASLLDDSDPAEPGLLYRKALDLIATEFEATTWTAFLRTVVDGQSAADVAADLKISRAAVYTAKSRVLKKLRDEFKELLDE